MGGWEREAMGGVGGGGGGMRQTDRRADSLTVIKRHGDEWQFIVRMFLQAVSVFWFLFMRLYEDLIQYFFFSFLYKIMDWF